jgi:hypothetical protein
MVDGCSEAFLLLLLLLVVDRGLVGDYDDYVIVRRDKRKAKKNIFCYGNGSCKQV